MSFYEVPYAEGIVCTGRSAWVFPDVKAGSLSGRAAYEFQNTSGQDWEAAFGVTPGYAITKVQVNGEKVPFSVSDYQEYNEAMLRVSIPAGEQVELTMEYAGFPRKTV